MGKGFDTFMENPYWRRQYEDAPSEDLKEYYRIMFDASGFAAGEENDDAPAAERLEELALSKEDVEYLLEYAGSGMARAHYQKILDVLTDLGDGYSVRASAFQAEQRNPYYMVFPRFSESPSSRIAVGKLLHRAEFEVIRERILSFTDDPDDFLVIDLNMDEPDALFIQAKRHDDRCYVEVGYDIRLPGQCYPMIVGNELSFRDAVELFSQFCVQGKNIAYTALLEEGFQIIRWQEEDAPVHAENDDVKSDELEV